MLKEPLYCTTPTMKTNKLFNRISKITNPYTPTQTSHYQVVPILFNINLETSTAYKHHHNQQYAISHPYLLTAEQPSNKA